MQELKDTAHVQSRSRKRSLHRSRSSEESGIAQYRDHDSIGTRCDQYLSLAAAYLVLICSIASTTNSDYSTARSSSRIAVLLLSSLSFVLTITLGILSAYKKSACGIITTKHASRKPPRRFTTLEHIVTPFISVFTCIASGMILYPRYDDVVISAEVAVKVNEVWNANIFYFSYICLYGSTYLMVKVFAQNGTTGASTHSSIRILLSMALFSSICIATSLMVMRHGPECNGYLDQMSYCSHSLIAVILSTLCTVLSLLLCVTTSCLELYHSRRDTRRRRSSSERLRDLQRSKTLMSVYKLILVVGTTLFVLLQFATYVTIVTSSSGGPSVILTSWIACMFSLLLWTTSCSQLQRMHQQDATVNERKNEVMKRLSSSTDTTTTEEYPYEPKIGYKFVRTPVQQQQQQLPHSQLRNHRQNKSPQRRNVAQADANYVFSSSLEHSLRDAQRDLLLRQASSHLQATKSHAPRPQRDGRSKEKNGNIQSHRYPSLEHVVLEEQKPMSYVKKEVEKQRRPDPLGNTSNNVSNPSRRIIRETRVNKTQDKVSILPSNIDNNGQKVRRWPPPPPSTPPPSRRRHIPSAYVQDLRCHNSRSRDEMLDRIPSANVQDAKSPPTTEYVSSSNFVNTDHRRMHHSSIATSGHDAYSTTSSSLFSLPVTADPSERSISYQTNSNNMSNVLSPLPELSRESIISVESLFSLPVTADPSKKSISHQTSNNMSSNLSTKFAESSKSLNLSGVFASNCSSKGTLDKNIVL